MSPMVTYTDIEQAHQLIRGHIHRTVVLTSQYFDNCTGAQLFFKCENFQKTGSFKIRGATNAVFSLSDEAASRGVATHSSGNYGAALSQAAAWRNISATVIVPENAPVVKKLAMEGYHANIILCQPTLQAREETLQQFIDDQGATFLHPYNHEKVIAGQGTAVKELIEDASSLDTILVPIGGGGLASGTAIASKHWSPNTKVIAVEPEMADDAARSFRSGKLIPSENPQTIADGLRTSLGDITFPLIQKHVDDIITVSEKSIAETMKSIWHRMKIIVEPSAAVPLAALLSNQLDVRGQKVGIILSGGNVEI